MQTSERISMGHGPEQQEKLNQQLEWAIARFNEVDIPIDEQAQFGRVSGSMVSGSRSYEDPRRPGLVGRDDVYDTVTMTASGKTGKVRTVLIQDHVLGSLRDDSAYEGLFLLHDGQVVGGESCYIPQGATRHEVENATTRTSNSQNELSTEDKQRLIRAAAHIGNGYLELKPTNYSRLPSIFIKKS